jgi:hypothetical protein
MANEGTSLDKVAEGSQSLRASSRIRKRTEKPIGQAAESDCEETKEKGPVDGVLVRKPRTEKKKKQTGGEDEEEELCIETATKDTASAQGKEAHSGEPEEKNEGDNVAKKLWGDTTPEEEKEDAGSKEDEQGTGSGTGEEQGNEGEGDEEEEPEEEPEHVCIPFSPQTGAKSEALMAGPLHLLGKEQKLLVEQAKALGIPILKDVDTTELKSASKVPSPVVGTPRRRVWPPRPP